MIDIFRAHGARIRLAGYAFLLTIVLAVIASLIFGSSYDPNILIPKKLKRNLRQASNSDPSDEVSSIKQLQQQASKDPFASRPKILTRNGHLSIESSLDKNIEFRTSGSRGSIVLNGHKLDQLFGVARALERSAQASGLLAANASSAAINSGPTPSSGPVSDQFELVLGSLISSVKRLQSLERSVESLQSKVKKLSKRWQEFAKRQLESSDLIKELNKRQETIVTKLKQNNCLEPETGQPVCKNGATCVDSYDTFKCLCPAEFEGRTCEQDVDECQRFRNTDLGCQNGAKCVNLAGGYKCECPPQYHGVHCTSLHDDCSLSSSASLCGHGKCISLSRTLPNQPAYECACDQGWTTDGHGPACVVDINECQPQLDGSSNGTQATTRFSSSLALWSGPETRPMGANYPCSLSPFVDCINLPGSFQCGPCPPGYTGNGRQCFDVDECGQSNGGCSLDPPVECINLAGSRRCGPCPPGFLGDGLTCRPVGPCTIVPNGGCHPMAKCIELNAVLVDPRSPGQTNQQSAVDQVNAGAGSPPRLCICQYPYTGTGVGLAGCLLASSKAAGPTGGDQATLGASNATMGPANDCEPSPCMNGAKCQLTDSSFECLCPMGWSGQVCELRNDFVCGGTFPASQGEFQFPVSNSFDSLIRLHEPPGSQSNQPAAPTNARSYSCVWSIEAPSNMSLKLTISQLLNKLDPTKRVRVHLMSADGAAGQVSSGMDATGGPGLRTKPPDCAEFLDVRDRMADALLARICTSSSANSLVASASNNPYQAASRAQVESPLQPISLVAESSLVDLHYSFMASRTQFLEPALSFHLNWTKVEPRCGGELPISDSGSISSPRFPEFYPPGTECRYLLRVAPGKRIRIQIGELLLMSPNPGRLQQVGGSQATLCSDSLTIYDGTVGLDRPLLFKYCGNLAAAGRPQDSLQQDTKVITSSSSSVLVVLVSSADSSVPLMRPKQRKGFYLTYASEPATPGCGGLYSAKSATIKSADFEPLAGSSADDQSLALEISRFFDPQQDHQLGTPAQPMTERSLAFALGPNDGNKTRITLDSLKLWAGAAGNKFKSLVGHNNLLYKTRCEYEIRPRDQGRDHRIELDWLEMPHESPTGSGSLARWTRRLRCARRRLTILNPGPRLGSLATEANQADAGNSNSNNDQHILATFCSGDRYSSSLPQLAPIISSGHALYLVYESSLDGDSMDELSVAASKGQSTRPSGSGPSSSSGNQQQPGGFKLHYSTVCSAIYRQSEGTIQVELDHQVDECVYHIQLPPNNSISLVIERPTVASSIASSSPSRGEFGEQPEDPLQAANVLKLPDGGCMAQAIFMDGAIPRGKLALAQMERRLRTFNFAQSTDSGPADTVGSDSAASSRFKGGQEFAAQLADDQLNAATTRLGDRSGPGAANQGSPSMEHLMAGDNDDEMGPPEGSANDGSSSAANSSRPNEGEPRYWQYASNQAHDIKEFNVCQLKSMGFDSTWNHMSLLFRLNPAATSPELGSSGDGAATPRRRLRLLVRYRAETSCGGIISEPSEGSIKLMVKRQLRSTMTSSANNAANRPRGNNTNGSGTTTGYPITMGRLERLQRQHFSSDCAWILRNPLPNQLIRLKFSNVPLDEIGKRQTEWIKWRRSVAGATGGQKLNASAAANDSTTTTTTTPTTTTQPSTDTGDGSSADLDAVGQLDGELAMDRAEEDQVNGNALGRCAEIYLEMIELYEPDANQTRYICPNELLEFKGRLRHWTSQSDTIYIRLLVAQSVSTNDNSSANSTAPVWPARKPLIEPDKEPMSLEWQMLSDRDQSKTTCGGRLIQSSGVITTPRHPFNYPSNMRCDWVIQAANKQQQIRLNFTKFEMEKQSNCWFDYLEIRNGPSESSPLIGRFCNTDLQSRVLISHSASVWLRFRSDAHLSRPGFRVQFDSATTGCGGLLTGSSGQIDSPNYPYAFAHSADCEWTIEVSQGNKIRLQIEDLDLRPTSGQLACQLDGPNAEYLQIIDGQLGASDSSVFKFCHLNKTAGAQSSIESSSNMLHLIYKSQALDYGRGFRLSYTTSCQFNRLAGTTGQVESPGYPSDYLPNLACNYVIQAPLGSNLSLALTDVDIEEGVTTSNVKTAAVQLSGSSPDANKSGPKICLHDQLVIWSIHPRPGTSLAGMLEPLSVSDLPTELQTNVNKTTNNGYSARQSKNLALISKSAPSGSRNTSDIRLIRGRFEFRLEASICDSDTGSDSKGAQRSLIGATLVQLSSSMALVQFQTDRAIEERGFHLEWRAGGCGGRVDPMSHQNWPLMFDDRINLTKWQADPSSGPIECLWLIDLSSVKSSVELDLMSDMRPLGGSGQRAFDDSSGSLCNETSQEASLSLYANSVADPADLLTRNCNERRRHESLSTTSSKLLIRLLISGAAASGLKSVGRSFTLSGWLSDRDSCSKSFYDIGGSYGEPAGVQKSPNYPDLYEAKVYKCRSFYSSLTVDRIRFTIEEMEIPVAGSGGGSDDPDSSQVKQQQPSALIRGEACQKSGSYLQIKSPASSDAPINELFCGTLAPNNNNNNLINSQSTVVTDQQTASVNFVTNGNQRGRWRLTHSRLCGASNRNLNLGVQEYQSANYPLRPQWPAASSQLGPGESENVCIWRLGSQDPSKKSIHFSLINFMESNRLLESPGDCLRLYEGVNLSLRQTRFNLTHLDLVEQPKLKICKQADVKHSSLYYVSRGSELVVMITGETVAKFQVKGYVNYCGGDYLLEQAEFASPGYPQNYGPSLDCHYFVAGSPGSQIELKFLTFNLAAGRPVAPSDSHSDTESRCDNADYIEIRQLSMRKRLLLKHSTAFASDNPRVRPQSFSKPDVSEWFKFVSENHDASPRDQMSQESTTRSPTTTANSVNSSLTSAATTITNNNNNRWDRNQAIAFSVNRLFELSKLNYLTDEAALSYHQHSSNRVKGRNSRLSMRLENFYAESKLIGRYCGQQVPRLDPKLLRDEILIRFRSHSSPAASQQVDNQLVANKQWPPGFLASYKINYGGRLELFENLDQDHFLGSPGFPTIGRSNSTITWIIETRPNYVLQFDLIRLSLGRPGSGPGALANDCRDSLSIFDGLNPSSSERLARLCGQLSFKSLISSSKASLWQLALNGTLDAARLPVHWAPNRELANNLLRPVWTGSNVASIVYENVDSDGLFLLRYRAVDKQSQMEQKSRLMAALGDQSSGRPLVAGAETLGRQSEFDLTGDEDYNSASAKIRRSKSCSRLIQLSAEPPVAANGTTNTTNDQAELLSPDWPKEPERPEIECHWLVYTPDGASIQLQIDPLASSLVSATSMDMEPATSASSPSWQNCFRTPRRNFVIIYDGASTLAPILGRHCLPAAPIQLQSSGRHLLVRYVHAEPTNGVEEASLAAKQPSTGLFRALARVATCGGQYYVTGLTSVTDRTRAFAHRKSPASPKRRNGEAGQGSDSSANKLYGNNLDCSYFMFAPDVDQTLLLVPHLSEFNLADRPTNSDCSVGDYIEIRDLPLLAKSAAESAEGQPKFDYSRALSGRSLGRFCAGKPVDYLESPGPALAIQFKTDARVGGDGFHLTFMNNQPRFGCPSGSQMLNLLEPYGRLVSPNWPHGFQGKRRCRYNLVAPANQTIQLTFVRLHRQLADQSAASQPAGPGNCADKFTYLADNEASMLVYDTRPLEELRSPLSGLQLRKLVRQLACRPQSGLTSSATVLRRNVDLLQRAGGQISQLMPSGSTSTITNTLTRLSESEYQQLMEATDSFEPSIIRTTSSHVLSLEYSANNLQPNEGFLAAYKLMDFDPKWKCGGDVYARPAKNVLESAQFGQLMVRSYPSTDHPRSPDPTEQPFVQCDWTIRLDTEGAGGGVYRFVESTDKTPGPEFSLLPNESLLGQFKTSFLAYQVLEIPALGGSLGQLVNNASFVNEEWSLYDSQQAVDVCGLTRMYISDFYSSHGILACGNLTSKYKWTILQESTATVSLRTKNIRQWRAAAQPASSAESSNDAQNEPDGAPIYRGLRAHLYETDCLRVERLLGDTLRIRSHGEFFVGPTSTTNNGSTMVAGNDTHKDYSPGICKWQLKLHAGQYRIQFNGKLNLRPPRSILLEEASKPGTPPPSTSSTKCNTDSDPTLDYLEFRASSEPNSPVLARFCYFNQVADLREHRFQLESQGELTILFVAGLNLLMAGRDTYPEADNELLKSFVARSPGKQQQFGFDLQLTRIKQTKVNDFCQSSSTPNIFQWIRRQSQGRYNYFDFANQLGPDFLYPKNVHCQVDMSLNESMRFNLTFVDLFDLEASKDCSADYVQIDDLIEPPLEQYNEKPSNDARSLPSSTTSRPASSLARKQKFVSSSTTSAPKMLNFSSTRLIVQRLGRWCGRNMPKTSYTSNSNKIRITFHSNEHIEGKGFYLDWMPVLANNGTSDSEPNKNWWWRPG